MQSSLPARLQLDLLDTTQISNPPPSFAVRLLLAVPRLVRFVQRLERGRPDAALIFVATGWSLVEKGAMSWYARLRGVRVLLFPRGGAVMQSCERSPVARVLIKFAFRGAHAVLCQGQGWQQFAQRTLGFDAARTPLIPNWTATPSFLAVGSARSAAPATRLRLLFAGWLEPHKGVRELLHAVAVLAKEFDLTLDIVGAGTLDVEVERFVAAHGLQSVVRRHGWLAGDDLLRMFAATDVLVLPSHAEGLPNVMIEAMASGAAVVVSRVGVVPDTITGGREGMLVPPRDVDSLLEALRRLAADPAAVRRMGRAGHELARARFSVEPAAQAIEAAIAAVLAGRTTQ